MSKYGHRSEICDDSAVLSMQQMWGEVGLRKNSIPSTLFPKE